MRIAKAKGWLRGKQPKLSRTQEKHLVEIHRTGTHPTTEIVELFNVARSTVYRGRAAGGTDLSRMSQADSANRPIGEESGNRIYAAQSFHK